ncbi:MAG: ferritin-like domain-containing protein [Candidatus Tectomicrobia bacterium]|uniref:Ferritin-like domain-containing protein n=1 Tax=Tectimicrobiota bacterium TaxID=2528274 RepID=A0A938AZF4_UNCTE|nr:ferritin-like domain-containing protein [Candidatus Tectomicrobia bacterium]
MDVQTFVEHLGSANQEVLERLAPSETLVAESGGDLRLENLLKIALKNELEATELAARWLVSTEDVDIKIALARQAGDEAKHYRLIADHLRALGVDLTTFDPLAQGYGPLFHYLDALTDPVERIAAGQFTREAIAVVKNQQFIDWCEAGGHTQTAALYRDIIQPDEAYHHQLGRDILLRLATTPEAQDRATQAATRTLELAEELQHLALTKLGVHHAPGC